MGPQAPEPARRPRARAGGGARRPPGLGRRAADRLHRGAARRGRRDRHLRAARRVRGAGRGAVDRARGLQAGARRDAREVAGGPARVRAGVRPLLLPRGGGGGRALQGVTEGEGFEGADQIDVDALREQIAAALQDGSEGAMRDLARLAIAAFGERGEGSGVIGVDVQRIRRSLGLRAEPQPDFPEGDPRRDGVPREQLRRFEQQLRRELERGADRAHAAAAARAAAERARPLAAGRADPGPRGRAPGRRAAEAAAGDAGQGAARAQTPCARGRAAHDARLAADRRRAGRAEVPPAAAATARSCSCCATSRPA